MICTVQELRPGWKPVCEVCRRKTTRYRDFDRAIFICCRCLWKEKRRVERCGGEVAK